METTKVNKCLGQGSSSSEVVDKHTGPTALSGPLK